MQYLAPLILFFLSTFLHAFELNLPFSSSKTEFLTVDQAFQLSLSAPENQAISAHWKIEEGYYLYQHQFKLTGPDADKLSFAPLPTGLNKTDAYFGEVITYRDQLSLHVQYDANMAAGTQINAYIGYQGCADKGLCYPPQKQPIQFEVPAKPASATVLPTTSPSTTNRSSNNASNGPAINNINNDFASQSAASSVVNLIATSSWTTAAVTLFGLGLLLAFTPCVLPMVPIVSAIVVGNRHQPWLAFYYSLLYVLSMAMTYAGIGALVGYFGLQMNLQALLQSPIILVLSSLVFVLLALAMFGVFELRLPSRLQRRLENQQNAQLGNKSLAVIFSGILATLIVSPCVSAPLAGVLLYVSAQGDTLYGALMLFVMALGMGIPLLLVGALGPKILPKSGVWLTDIKIIMGFGLLAVAIWLLNRWFAVEYSLYFWGVLLLAMSAYFLHKIIQGHSHPVRLTLTLVLFIFGLLQLIGGATGTNNFARPLEKWLAPTAVANQSSAPTLQYNTITSLAELTSFIDKHDGQVPIMLDFYADWCISCQVIEEEIFKAPDVYALLKQVALVRVDVTDNTAESQAIMQRFNTFGPPSIIFLTSTGVELTRLNIIGEPTKAEVKERLLYLNKAVSQISKQK